MKHIYYILLLTTSISYTQNTETKSILSATKEISITIEQADAIHITHNNNNLVMVKMTSYPLSKFTFTLEEKEHQVFIISEKAAIGNTSEINKICKEEPFYPTFEISLPKNKNIYIYYKHGNFFTTNFTGNITLEAENSNLHINGFKGNLNLTVLAGFVECAISNSSVNINCSKSTITTHFEKQNKYTKKLELKFQNPVNSLKIKTIYANVLLKPFKTE